MDILNYKNNFKQYTENGNIDSDININAVTFINKGTTTAIINDTHPITAGGGSLSIGGNIGEIDKTLYKVGFATAGAPVDTNLLIVINKQYV